MTRIHRAAGEGMGRTMNDLKWLAGCGGAGVVLGGLLWLWVELSLTTTAVAPSADALVRVSAWR